MLTAGKRGAVLLVEWDSFRALLPVGVGVDDFEILQYRKSISLVSVLLLVEQGYALAYPGEWISNLNLRLVVLIVGEGLGHGMAAAVTLMAIKGYNTLMTDRDGWVEVVTYGESMMVKVERNQPFNIKGKDAERVNFASLRPPLM